MFPFTGFRTGCLISVVTRWSMWTCHLLASWLDFRVRPQLALLWRLHGPSIGSPTGGTICPAPKQRAIEIKEKMGDSQSLSDPPFHEGVIQGWSSAQNVALTVCSHCLCLSMCVWFCEGLCVCAFSFIQPIIYEEVARRSDWEQTNQCTWLQLHLKHKIIKHTCLIC